MTFSAWMKKRKLKDAQAAELFGCHRAHISKVRRGVINPSFELAQRIYKESKGRVDLASWDRADSA